MANIDKVKLGGNSPSALMHGEVIPNPVDFPYDFTQWTVNESAGHDIKVTLNKIVIKKFKPNTLLLKSNLSSAIPADVCSYMKNVNVKLSGLTYWFNKGMFANSTSSDIWYKINNDPYYVQGISFVPTYPDGRNYTGTFPWELRVADGYLKNLDNGNFGFRYFGYWKDCYKCIYDSPVDSFTTLWNSASGYQAGFFIYTNDTKFLQDGLIDVSEHPIEIMLDNNNGYDMTNEECWNAYMGDTQVYHKEKTVENALIKYGLAHMRGNELVIDAASAKSYGKYRIDPLDVANYLATGVRLNCKPVNSDIADLLTLYVSTNYLPPSRLQCYGDERGTGIYGGSNIQSATLNVALSDPESKQYMTLACPFSESEVHSATINVGDGCRISATQRMFYHAGQLTEILFNGTPCGATDCSGMFEGASKITEYPANLINWDLMGSHKNDNYPGVTWSSSHMGWFCDGSGMKYIVNASTGNNVIQIGMCYAMFRNCSSLLLIGPTLDFSYIHPDTTSDYGKRDDAGNVVKENDAADCLDCPNLITAKIKNLNHGDWHFDGGVHGNLSSLDPTSIAYLFNNLTDLTAANTVQEGHPAYHTKTSANLYVPTSWISSVTSAMLTAAKNKGWTVYIGGNKQN